MHTYKILEGDARELAEKVMELLNEDGWLLHGEPVVTGNEGKAGLWYAQAMVKHEKAEYLQD